MVVTIKFFLQWTVCNILSIYDFLRYTALDYSICAGKLQIDFCYMEENSF